MHATIGRGGATAAGRPSILLAGATLRGASRYVRMMKVSAVTDFEIDRQRTAGCCKIWPALHVWSFSILVLEPI